MGSIAIYSIYAILLTIGGAVSGNYRRFGAIIDKNRVKLPLLTHDLTTKVQFPERFDAREHWGNCPSLWEIRDQGDCGSCWAFATVETMTDRVCIHSNGETNFHFSANDLLACCDYCSKDCTGGDPLLAWKYWVEHGIVSGGGYNSSEGCSPYEVVSEPDYRPNRTRTKIDDKPACRRVCHINYSIPYDEDLHFGKTYYHLENGVKQIQAEIMKNGPVVATFDVYPNFHTYNDKEVYKTTEGEIENGHAVKIIGWGVENGTPYWLFANSWNQGFGEQGFGKFLRGQNFCNIENDVTAGIPAF